MIRMIRIFSRLLTVSFENICCRSSRGTYSLVSEKVGADGIALQPISLGLDHSIDLDGIAAAGDDVAGMEEDAEKRWSGVAGMS